MNLPLRQPATKNFVISGTNFWNPGDDFVREGVIRILRQLFPDHSINFLFYNFNADFFPQDKFSGISNFAARGDLDRCRDSIDGVVIAGLSAGDEIKDLYRWVIDNRLEDRVYLIGAGYENGYVATHVGSEPEATIFKRARVITGRTAKTPEFIRASGIPYFHINCPAILSVPEVKSIAVGRKIERIGFSIQLPHGEGLVNHSCAREQFELATAALKDLARTHLVEVIAHHKTEYFHFLNALRGTGIPVLFSSFYQDLFDIYRRYDLVVTTRLHSSLFANGHGVPGIIINDTDRHTHTLDGFPHSSWVNTRDGFDRAFAQASKLDLAGVAAESRVFKKALLAQYVAALSTPFGANAAPAAQPAESYQFDSELKEQALVRRLVLPGMTVFDVGANIGKYTKLFSLLAGSNGRVFAFEPSPASCQRIEALVRTEKLSNVTLLNQAVNETESRLTLHQFPEEYSSWNSLGQPRMDDPRDPTRLVPLAGTIEVEGITLDGFCRAHGIQRIDYLKLDVEGAEFRALEGARQLLDRKAIGHLQFEISQRMLEGLNTTARRVFQFLEERGYECHAITATGEAGGIERDSASFYENYIAFPARPAAASTTVAPSKFLVAPSTESALRTGTVRAPGQCMDVASADPLPIHFFTIVLNGRPFIEQHIRAFERLPFRWHWHIVEGVAELAHDTAWSRAHGGRITGELHRNGLSKDGTSDYLDELAHRFPANVTVYRKPGGAFWDGKQEMVNAPLANIREECLLWEVDADELWTDEQLTFARRLFLARPDKTAAYFFCHYFVGPNLVTTTRDTYGNNTSYEWLRAWRFKPGCRWLAHEPPRLCQPNAGGEWADVATLNPFLHRETEALDLVFQHYAYATEPQLAFKEVYYGYAGAVEQWRGLQAQKQFPVRLRDHFAWVKDGAEVNTAASQGIVPLLAKEDFASDNRGARPVPVRSVDSSPFAISHPPRATAVAPAASRDGSRAIGNGSGVITPFRPRSEPKRILYVRTDAIGDAVLSAPILRELRLKFPQAQIAALGQEQLGEFYLACPFVDLVIGFDLKRAQEQPAYRTTIAGEVAQFDPDLILNPVFSSDAVTEELVLSHPRAEVVGFAGDQSNIAPEQHRAAKARYTHLIPGDGERRHELDRHRDFLAALGIDAGPLQASIWTTPDDERVAEEFFERNKLDPARTIALFPYTQHSFKNYPDFGLALQEFTGWNFLVLGGQESEAPAEALARVLPGPALNLTGRTSLREMAAMIRRSRILVGSDSCGVHLACAVGVPNVVVLGGGHFGRFLPYSRLTSAVCQPLACYNCNWVCSFGSFPCTKKIEAAVVAEVVRATLAKPSSKPRLFVQGAGHYHPAAGGPVAARVEQFINASEVEIIEVANGTAATRADVPVAASPSVNSFEATVDSGLKEVHDNWNEFGKRDPLWSILTVDSKKNNQWDLVEFFAAGEREISGVMRYLQNIKAPLRRGKAMDFGCGVGRLTQALCPEFEECHGVDIAESMVALADQYNRFGSRCQYHVNVSHDLRVFTNDTFDFIYSNIVLQHNKPAHSRKFIQEFLRILAPGGLVVFQIPSEPVFGRSDESQLPANAFRAVLTSGMGELQTTAGACLDVRVRIKNSSPVAWPAAQLSTSKFALRLGNHWLNQHGHTIAMDDGRTSLTRDVQPGEEIELSVSARVPTRPGNYLLELDLVQESVAWFKDKASPTLKIPVQVAASAASHPDTNRDAVSELHGWFKHGTPAAPTPAAAAESTVLVPRMEMNGMPKAEVVKLLESCGGTVLDITEDNAAAGWLGFRYCVAKAPAPVATARHLPCDLASWLQLDQPAPRLRNTTVTARFKVSAIVSAYKAEKFLPHCLRDLTGQTLYQKGELEIIVIDSGSTQNEEGIVREFQQAHPDIVYLRTERETLYAAWNRGVEMARGQFITNANVDDAHRPDALEKLAAALEANPDADLAYNHVAWTPVENDSFPSPTIQRTVVVPAYHPALALFYCFTGCHQFWRRSAFEKIGLFNPSFTAVGDYEILQRFTAAGLRAVLVPEVLSLFYQNPHGLSAQSDKSQQEETVVRKKFRSEISIQRIFQVEHAPGASGQARAWVALGNLAMQFPVPWLDEMLTDENFALHCYEQAARQEPNCWPAIYNRTLLYNLCGRSQEWEAELSKLLPAQAAVIRQAMARGDWNLIAVSVPPAVTALEFRSGADPFFPVAPAVQPKARLTIQWLNDPASAEVKLPVRWLGPIFNPSGYASEAINYLIPLSPRLDLGLFHQNNIYSEKFVAGLAAKERAMLFHLRDRFPAIAGGISISHNPANGMAHPADSGYRIGRTMFETDRVSTAWVSACNQMDEVWVPSQFNLETFAASGVERDKLQVVPEAVDEQVFSPALHQPLPLPHRAAFNFLSIFEWSSRKGWDVLLAAYLREFSAADDVCLYLRTYLFSKPDGDPAEALWKLIREHAATLGLGEKPWPRVELLAEQVPLEDLPRLYAAADCLVAPSRGEGWGRPHHEAMMMGLPVIATNWSGNTEFMNPENSYLIDYELIDVGQVEPELWHYRGGRWANPSETHLRQLMRQVQQNPEQARQKGARARADMVKHFSRSPVANEIIHRLQGIERKLTVPSCPPAPKRSTPSALDPSSRKLREVKIAWEGSFLDLGSLSHVNRELTRELGRQPGLCLERIGKNGLPSAAAGRPDLAELARRLKPQATKQTQVTVRHAWPPCWERPAHGAWVLVQPWEFGVLPAEWVRQIGRVDEVWAPSEYVRRVYVDSGVEPHKVKVVPNGIDPQRFRPAAPPLKLATGKSFKFLFVGGTIQRKGPDVLLDAYLRHFTAGDDVCLVIKDFGGKDVYAGQTFEAQIKAAQARPDAPEILYLNTDLSADEVAGLYTACDCLVHPYRGEGFGLPVLEAMACGLPVVVTGGGATDDFATDEFAYRVAALRQSLPGQIGGLPLVRPGWWLEPDGAAVGDSMRHVFKHRDEAREKGRRASEHVRTEWTWERTARIVAQRSRELIERRSAEVEATRARRSRKPAPIVAPPAARVGLLAAVRGELAAGQFVQAWNATAAAIQARPHHPEAWLLLAEIALAAGDAERARVCAHHARDLAPKLKVPPAFSKGTTAKPAGAKVELPPLPELPCPTHDAPRLSVCIITKNEEQFLPQCLASVRAAAHQIVVVDTGSTDRTVAIAQEAGAEVYSFKWCDDFSAARNAALERATGDWILILDADEELPPASAELLKQEIQDAQVIAYRLPIVDRGREEEGHSYVPRLFRNAPGLFFVGRVHEQVFSSVEVRRREWGLQNKLSGATILHHGYALEVQRQRGKVARNLSLLERAVEEIPNEPNLLMSYGLELMRSGQRSDGLAQYAEAMQVMSGLPADQIVPELRETLVTQFATHLLAEKDYAGVTAVLNSPLAKAAGPTASMHFMLGLALMETGRHAEAIEQFRLCLSRRDRPALAPIHKDIRGAAPHHCLAICLKRAKQPGAAAKSFAEGLKEQPDSRPLRHDYARFLAEQGNPVEGLQLLHQLVGEKPDEESAWVSGGQIALSRPDFLEFAHDWTGEALKHFPDNPIMIEQRAQVLLLSQRVEESLPMWHTLIAQPTARRHAALLLCQLAGGQRLAPPASEEPAVSAEFVEWYKALLQANAGSVIAAVNRRLDPLRQALPSAARILGQAVTEADKEVAA